MDGLKILVLIMVSCFSMSDAQANADFKYVESCYSAGQTLTLEAVYTGIGTPSLVQWSYSEGGGTNLLITTSDCLVFGSVPLGYPSASRMKYKCSTTDANLPANSYTLAITGLTSDELTKSWGATFTPPSGSAPAVIKVSIEVCRHNTTTITTNYSSSITSPSATVTEGQDITDDIIIGASVGGGIFIVIVICVIVGCYIRHKTNKSKAELQTRKMTDIKNNSDL